MASKAYSITSKQNSSLGSDTYRLDSSVPNMFKPTMEYTVGSNKAGTNHQVNIMVRVPVPVTGTDGRITSTDTFTAQFRFTSLQNVDSPVLRAQALDTIANTITAARQSILDGSLPDNPLTVSVEA